MISPESSSVIACARAIIAKQEKVPVSPAELSADGSVNLCLAAAFAKAGFLLNGWKSEAEDLSRELAQTRSKDRLKHAFQRLGWLVSDCETKLELNDRANDSARKMEIMDYLDALQVKSAQIR